MNNVTHSGLQSVERSAILLNLLVARINDSSRFTESFLNLLRGYYADCKEGGNTEKIGIQLESLSLAFERLYNDMNALRTVLLSPATEICIDGDSPFLESFRQEEPLTFNPSLSKREVQQYAPLLT